MFSNNVFIQLYANFYPLKNNSKIQDPSYTGKMEGPSYTGKMDPDFWDWKRNPHFKAESKIL